MPDTPDLAGWAARYAAANLPVLPLHSVRDGRCSCRTDCGRNAGKHPISHHGPGRRLRVVDSVANRQRRRSAPG